MTWKINILFFSLVEEGQIKLMNAKDYLVFGQSYTTEQLWPLKCKETYVLYW